MSIGDQEHEPPATGTLVGGKYRVLGVVGSGGMGCLVKAQHLLLKKDVAIKFVMAKRLGTAKRRLLREGRAAQSLASEHVVRVYDLGLHEDAPYIVMELLEGTDLAARVRAGGPLPIADAVDFVLEACVAVAEAHGAGIIHRDIKPANLFLARIGTRDIVKVLDFGISKVPPSGDNDDPDKTAEDAVLGTPHYASPEQLRNPTKIDGRADVWSLGVTLFYLLTGEHPFPGSTAREAIAATFGDPPRSIGELRPEVPDALREVIERTLAKRPERRTASVSDLARELEPFASKRGKIAAQLIAERPQSPVANAPSEPDRAPAESLTTEESLSSTLSSTDAGLDERRNRDQKASSRSRLGPVLALALVGIGGLWYFGVRGAAGPIESGNGVASSEPRAEPPAPTEVARAATSAVASAVPPPPIDPPAAPSATTAPVVTAGPKQPLNTARAAPKPSASASGSVPSAAAPPTATSPVRRDIDGIPIVD
jgi:serine/threonine-protein kinase